MFFFFFIKINLTAIYETLVWKLTFTRALDLCDADDSNDVDRNINFSRCKRNFLLLLNSRQRNFIFEGRVGLSVWNIPRSPNGWHLFSRGTGVEKNYSSKCFQLCKNAWRSCPNVYQTFVVRCSSREFKLCKYKVRINASHKAEDSSSVNYCEYFENIHSARHIVLRAVYEPTIKLAVHCVSCCRSVFAKVNVYFNVFYFGLSLIKKQKLKVTLSTRQLLLSYVQKPYFPYFQLIILFSEDLAIFKLNSEIIII